MGYNFSTKDRASKNEKTPMTPGKEVKAVFVKSEVDDKGNIFFHFRNDTGTFRHKEFAIDPSSPNFKPEWADNQMERINHIACALVDSAKVDAIPGDVPFATWAGQLAALLNTAADTEVVLHIVVHNNYISFPLYINFISSERAKCGWTSNPQYHKYEFVDKSADKEEDARSAVAEDNAGLEEADEEF